MINKTFSSVLVMLALGVLTPMQANAFGLGKLELSSALNEPFRAKIPVTALREDEEGNLQVRLATNEEFARAGIERSYYLTQLTFNIVEHPGGATIEVTSQHPIKEPFVDFLLTATTGEGRLIREYTVLLDPPKSVFVKPSKTITPTQAKKASPSSSAKTTHNYPESTYQAPSSTNYSGNTYGPTQRDDTLWDIALATKPSSVSVHQMMIALLNANPSAFIKNNINNLKTGQTLTIPSVDEISKLSHRQAVARVSEQWQQWKSANKVVVEVQQKPELSEGSNDGETLQTAEHAGAGEADARLQLVVDSEDTPTTSDELTPLGNDELKKLRDQLTLAQETIEGQKQENIDFKARMDAMEQQLEIMRKIIMVKDADLARLQSMLGEEESGELASNNLPEDMQAALDENQTNDLMATEPEVVAEPQQAIDEVLDEVIDSNVLVPAERMVDEDAVAAAAQAAREEAEYSGAAIFVEPDPVSMVAVDSLTEVETTTPVMNELLQEHRMLDEAAVAAAVQSAKEEAAYSGQAIFAEDNIEDEMAVELEEELTDTVEKEATEVVDANSRPVVDAPSEIGLLDKAKTFIAENKLPVLGGLIALFLGLLAWVFVRRRNQDEYEWVDTESLEEATESEVTTAEPNIEEQLTDTSAESSTEEQAQDSSLPDTTENIDDLLNKAEMSIAYGEYDEARETIEQAMRQDPSNQAITLKLLALAYHQKQTAEFNSLVAKVDLDKDSADWKEVLAWGSELDPENELYKQDVVNEKEIDLSEPLETLEDSGMADLEIEDSLDESAVESIEEQLTDSQDDSMLSFDNDFDLEKSSSIEDDTPLEFDTALTLDIETDKDSDITLTEEPVDDDLELVLDISDLNDDADNMLDTELEELADNITEELPELETVSIVEATEIKEEVEELDIGADDLEFDIGDFDEVDEAETKLDLAAAYVDMGDPDGAKNILNEVLEEGNDEQKSRAQDLLNNLAK